jgi:hypothetical protein
MKVGLLFNGVTGEFDELPPPGDPQMESVYKSISDKYVKKEQTSFNYTEPNTIKDESDEEMPF